MCLLDISAIFSNAKNIFHRPRLNPLSHKTYMQYFNKTTEQTWASSKVFFAKHSVLIEMNSTIMLMIKAQKYKLGFNQSQKCIFFKLYTCLYFFIEIKVVYNLIFKLLT
jgi:hypothetical protein